MLLRPVNADSFPDQWWLYSVLRSRMLEPDYNISHKHMPSWEEHLAFLKSDPYRWWDVVIGDGWYERLGVAYVTKNNEVGIWIASNFRKRGLASKVLQQYQAAMRMWEQNPYLLANINPKNEPSQKFFKKHGFKLITKTSGADGMQTYRWEAA